MDTESTIKGSEIVYTNEIIKIEEEYRTGGKDDFYDKWNKLTKDNGLFDAWVNPYHFVSKALTPKQLQPIKQEDSSFIFNRFLEILRHNVVSDKPNAFNKIFTLFLCKIYDEKFNEDSDNELGFQWIEGVDNDVSFQLRLTDLYKNGMLEFLEKKVTDFSDDDFDKKYATLFTDENIKALLKKDIAKLRLEKNNEFAIKEVYDEKSFNENAKVVKEVVELLQGFKIRYTKKQQYLSDFFEMLLTTGLKQESGQFFTPVPVAQFIIKSLPIDAIVQNKLQAGKKDELLPYIIDYAAGSGHFLTESMHEIQRILDKMDTKKLKPDARSFVDTWRIRHFDWALQYVYGIEKDYRLVKVGKVGCYLHGDGLANVIHSDGLASFNHKDYKLKLKVTDTDFPKENKQFEIIISNPPYSVSSFKNASTDYYKEQDFELYNKLTDNSSEIECLFIERTKQLLKDGGLAGIILPSSILSNTGIYTKAREIILQYFDIVAITELGSNTFMATGTNTVTLFLIRRNNYVSSNLKIAVNKFFTTLQDVTLNGIETPVAKYINHVFNSPPVEGLGVADYTTLLQRNPNNAIQQHEIYIEYRKKIKAKNDKEFYDIVLEKEAEKLYYFILTYNQQIVLVKSGEKDAEKRFLGYEFSNRRGSEGIHPMQRGKNIEDCTQLFDADVFDNPTKASTYIYQAFNGDYTTPIDTAMQSNITRHNLVDMLTFDRVDFEKNISLSIKKKVNPIDVSNSKYEIRTLQEVADFKRGPFGGSLKKEIFVENGYKIYEQQHAIKNDFSIGRYYITKEKFEEMKSFELIKDDIIMSCSGTIGKIAIFPSNAEKGIINQALLRLRPYNNISVSFLKILLEGITNSFIENSHGAGLQNVASVSILKDIKIPLPPLNIQQQIVAEIEALEATENKAKQEVEELKKEIENVINAAKGTLIQLQDITTKIGSGATPRGGEAAYIEKGITLIRSQNVYDSEFYPTGLVYIDDDQAKKLNNVTVEENDILFNITGASVCRCCIVDKTYLPARVNQHVSIIRTNEKALPKYVQNILVSEEYKNKLLQIGEGATSREAITKAQLEDFKIPLPTIKEQQKIVSQIQTIETKISALQRTIANIPQQKEAVLKKYL